MVEALLAGMVLALGLAVVYLWREVPSDEYHEGIEDQLRDLNERIAQLHAGYGADYQQIERRLNDLTSDDNIEKAVLAVNERVNVLEAKVDALPDVASIITAATAPLVQVVSPPPIPPAIQQQVADEEAALAEAWADTYDPTDDEFPVRAADDYSPPPRMMGAMGLDV